jgi:hypothetical protein
MYDIPGYPKASMPPPPPPIETPVVFPTSLGLWAPTGGEVCRNNPRQEINSNTNTNIVVSSEMSRAEQHQDFAVNQVNLAETTHNHEL